VVEGTDGIRALARRVRAHAAETEADAADALAAVTATPWRGDAARAAEASARQGAAGLGRTSGALRDAADALDDHAAAVDRRLALLRALGDRAAAYADELGLELPDLPDLPDLPWSA